MVFNRFWRADPARARTTGGTGLGLAIALEDARLHGGWLQAWGTPGGGAQFRLTLPRRAGDPLTHSPLPLVPRDVRGGASSERAVEPSAGDPRRAARRVALAGCTTLPGVRGRPPRGGRPARPDRRTRRTSSPPGPAKDGTPSAIVSGFLVAMQANPLSTSVAREFLTERARAAWKPNRGTIVYEAFTVRQTTDGAAGAAGRHPPPRRARRLAAAARRAARRRSTSSWSPRTASGASTTRSTRWSCPPSFFDRSFARFNLYFYDQTGRVLLPDPVFIPRGEQTATNLVRGLLAGSGLQRSARSPARRCPRAPTSTCRWWSPRAAWPRCRCRARCCAPRPASSAAPSTSSPGRCARCPASSACGSPSAVRRSRCPAAASTRRSPAAPSSTPPGPATAELWGLRGGRVVDLGSSDPVPRSAARWVAPATRCAASP